MTETPRRGGFTLLELIVTLSIVALFIGAALSFTHPRSRKIAEQFDAELQVYIRGARSLALQNDASVYLHFTPSSILLSPEITDAELSLGVPALAVPPDLELYSMSGSRWVRITKGSPYVQLFSRSGLTEPFQIRFRYEEADFEYSFDALSAMPVETEL
ncbi:Tfp pilus assembly protein FimT/FimU [Luteolibacter sp. AS25]|uniref:Tfp pilus assembly protein FimT/FimU n=1 Tax=Luteolibacter sp. AS25 TaxID=3135776 RepID=UPI00398B6F42